MDNGQQKCFGFAEGLESEQLQSKREYERQKQARLRALERDITIPPIADRRRRGRCRKNPVLFCRTYFRGLFYHPFTPNQKQIVQAIVDRIHQGGYQAIAAARGDGKSSITNIVGAIWAIVYGHIKYIVLLGANGLFAQGGLADVKAYYEFNDLLAADFPEICTPIRALEGAPQRAKSQTAAGRRTRLQWSGQEVIFPDVVGSKAAGSIITTRGVDAAIRGLVRQGRRPDLVIADDIETRESARSAAETESRQLTLGRDVLGLAGPGRQLSVVYLCTILHTGCLSDQITDRKENPAWHGIRQKFLVCEPEDKMLWDKYVELRRTDQLNGDGTARNAHKYYRKNRRAMDAGAQVNNPHRYLNERLPKGGKMEISAIQHAFNLIADMGKEAFEAEYQNNPADFSGPETSGLNITAVCKKLSHLARGVVPLWAEKITVGIDVGGRAIHWVVAAWKAGLSGYVIDYGTEPVHSPQIGRLTSRENQQSTEAAILAALIGWRDWQREGGWAQADTAEVRHLDLALVDSGWLPDPVYEFCRTTGGLYKPSKGFGTGSGQSRYRSPARRGTGKRIGSHWYSTRPRRSDLWLYNLDSDYFKQTVHSGILTPAEQAGSISVYGSEPVIHRGFAEQICAELYTREFRPGKGWIEGFVPHYRHNHFLDALMAAVAAAVMLGIRILSPESPTGEAAPGIMPRKPVKLSEIQRQRRGGQYAH